MSHDTYVPEKREIGSRHPVTGKRVRKRGRRPKVEREPGERMLTQAQFTACEYFLQGYNKREALLKAGYSASYAQAPEFFFDNPGVNAYISKRRDSMKMISSRLEERIKEELAKIAFFNLGHIVEITDDGDLIYNFDEVTMDQMAALGEITVETYIEGKGPAAREVKRIKVKPHDKKAALDSLARIQGMFKDNVDVTSGGKSLEERLQAGRARLGMPKIIDGEFEREE